MIDKLNYRELGHNFDKTFSIELCSCEIARDSVLMLSRYLLSPVLQSGSWIAMGALHLPSKGKDTSNYTTSLQAPAEIRRSPGLKRTKAPSPVRNFVMILVAGMLAFIACLPSSYVLADGIPSLSQLMEPSAESESGVDFKSAKPISSRCTEGSYAKFSDYDFNVKYLLSRLIEGINVDVEVWEDASDYYDNLDTVYGVAGCTNLTPEGCKLCLSHIVTNLEVWCPHLALKAEIILDTCFLRYDNYYLKVPLKGSLRTDKH